MKLIEKAVAHFSQKVRRELYVKEWDATVYAKNLTLEDKSSWLKKSDGDTTQYLLYAVIYGLMDENDQPVFDIGDKPKLEKGVDPEVVGKIASFVIDASGATDEDREKN
jgi:hypothetical protein